ncbi:FAD-dependent oxidoreductase, partial [Streptomyces asiaticus]
MTRPTGRPAAEAAAPATALRAPAPGWATEADVVVVGSGVAGLTVALRCAAAGARVTVVTKARLDDGSTRWAQGGVVVPADLGDREDGQIGSVQYALLHRALVGER